MADTDEGDGGAEALEGGAAKKKKMMMIIIAAAVLLLGGVGGGLYFLVFAGSGDSAQAESSGPGGDAGHGAKDAQGADAGHGGGGDGHGGVEGEHSGPGGVAYFDLPEFLVNIQGVDGSAAYLKLSVSLEMATDADRAGVESLQPRITDQLQAYLRELRTDDLKGSAGVMRVKEEMLRRIKVASAPYKVRDVLLKEMVVQ